MAGQKHDDRGNRGPESFTDEEPLATHSRSDKVDPDRSQADEQVGNFEGKLHKDKTDKAEVGGPHLESGDRSSEVQQEQRARQ
jgi:hypothetical protein